MCSSTDEPNTNSMSMLNARCRIPACMNMYVMNVQGCFQASRGANASAFVSVPSTNSVFWTRNTSRLATSSRLTHGVKPYIRCGPIDSPTCPLGRLVLIPPIRPCCSGPGLRYGHTARERGSPPPARPEGTDLCGSFPAGSRSEEHTSELQSRGHLVCRLLLEKKK